MIYEHTQHVPIPVFTTVAALGLAASLLTPGRFGKPAVLATVAGTAYTFRSMKVTVDSSSVRIQYGGWLNAKTIMLRDMLECLITQTNPWSGWGIHYSRAGMVYNIYGLDAVEIILKTGERIFIGTDEPSELAAAIRERIYQRTM